MASPQDAEVRDSRGGVCRHAAHDRAVGVQKSDISRYIPVQKKPVKAGHMGCLSLSLSDPRQDGDYCWRGRA